MTRAALLVALAAGLVAPAGCSGGKAGASGKVTYRGRPVTSGTVIMIGPDDRIVYGQITPDGMYAIGGVEPGTVKVGVASPNPADAIVPPADGGRGKAAAPKPKAAPPAGWVKLPAKSAQPDSSGLTAALGPGPNTHDIAVVD